MSDSPQLIVNKCLFQRAFGAPRSHTIQFEAAIYFQMLISNFR